jgi:hypothetical protein
VGALTELARSEVLQGRAEAGLRYADEALSLAERLGLPRPARALGYRGGARRLLADRAGLDDYREAITLATEAGQGREVALLHNNLAEALWPIQGPAAALEILQAGIVFAQSRGLTESADVMTSSTRERLEDSGRHEQALTLTAGAGERFEAGGNLLDLTSVRSLQVRILTLRGQADQIADQLDWLESTTREAAAIEYTILNLAAAAAARAAIGQRDEAAALLGEIEAAPDARETSYYLAYLPLMVRIALSVGNLHLAEQLAAGVELRTPSAEHALVTVDAMLAEAHGDQRTAAEGYADAARRWQQFGVVPEQAFALLGQGRCLVGLGRPTEATPALRAARTVFNALQAAPALAETDTLLQQASALSA